MSVFRFRSKGVAVRTVLDKPSFFPQGSPERIRCRIRLLLLGTPASLSQFAHLSGGLGLNGFRGPGKELNPQSVEKGTKGLEGVAGRDVFTFTGPFKAVEKGSEDGRGVEVIAKGLPGIFKGSPVPGYFPADKAGPVLFPKAGLLKEGRNTGFQFVQPAPGRLEAGFRKVELLPVMAPEEGQANLRRMKPLFEEVPEQEKITQALGHFLPLHKQVDTVHPVPGKGLPGGGLALGNFILVMGETEVLPSAVKVEGLTEVFHAHRGTFEMPTGTAPPPGTLPGDPAVRLPRGLPEGKVRDGIPFILVGQISRTGAVRGLGTKGLGIEMGEFPVAGKGTDPVVDRPVPALVGMPRFHQGLNKLNLLRNVVCGPRLDFRGKHVQEGAVLVEFIRPLAREGAQFKTGLLRTLNRLVVHIGYIAHVIGLIATETKEAIKDVKTEKGEEVPDMRRPVDRWPADIQPEPAIVPRRQIPHLTAQGVKEAYRFHVRHQRICLVPSQPRKGFATPRPGPHFRIGRRNPLGILDHTAMSASSSIGLIKLVLIVPVIAYLGLVLFALLFANGLIFPAPAPSYETDTGLTRFRHNDKGEEVTLRYLENPRSRLLVFYQHGNGEDLGRIEDRLNALVKAGFSVLAWDYPGYGSSDGRPSEREVLRIAAKIWDSIPETYGFSHQQTVLYGRSIGSGPATWLASRNEAAGLIIEGGFTSIFDVALPVKLLPWDIFDNRARLAGVRSPVLIIHGTLDETIPFSHGQALFEAAPSPKFFLWVSGGLHNDLIEAYPENFFSSIAHFRDHILENAVLSP